MAKAGSGRMLRNAPHTTCARGREIDRDPKDCAAPGPARRYTHAMTVRLPLTTPIAAAVLLVVGLASARADQRAERAAIAGTLTKLSASATTVARAAQASDDRGARKKFGPAATELGDDLAALAKRVGKDVALKSIATDAAAIDKDATALIELADEADDKDERKSLRSQAVLIEQGVAGVRKAIDAVKDDDQAPRGATKFTGRLFNNSNDCSWEENLKFVVSRNGQQVFVTQNMVFPGHDVALVLDAGSYVVQLLDTSGKFLGQRPLEAGKEGWSFKSGCVNQD